MTYQTAAEVPPGTFHKSDRYSRVKTILPSVCQLYEIDPSQRAILPFVSSFSVKLKASPGLPPAIITPYRDAATEESDRCGATN